MMNESKKYMELSARLSAIAENVTPGSRVADIGCDHAHLPIRLCQEDKIPSAIAMDVNPGPLERAKANIEAAGLADRIRIRLSDGLEKLEPGEADVAVIAGMGGQLITAILGKKPLLIAGAHAIPELVLGPHSEADKVRRFLEHYAYDIVNEDFIEEDGKYYPVIKARKRQDREKTETGRRKLDDAEIAYGPVLLREKNPVLHKFLLQQQEQLRTISVHLKKQQTENARNRLASLSQEAQLVTRALERIELG
ncbi:MAG: class I SAM-dependent methyltransferase [Eubacterium sp.]|nr:class I SAM-dependent methyltransferase [Eubacterium sp.]